jgi:predicted KAP-like P-loop ATPase
MTSFDDLPVREQGDLLGFRRYVRPIVELLRSDDVKTPLTIGVFGPWGSGKSTLLELIDQEMAKPPDRERFVRVRFNPWVHRREANVLVPLLHALHDRLEEDQSRFAEPARRIFEVLARLGLEAVLKALTINTVDLKKLEDLEKDFLKSQKKIESEMRQLRETLRQEAERIRSASGEPRLVFLIDDLDRCRPDEILDVLESVKLFLDVPNVIVIIAMDKDVVDRGIQVKYSEFAFSKDREALIGSEYLEKIVQLPLILPPLGEQKVAEYIRKLGLPQVLQAHESLLAQLMPPNPRKIKRILNALMLAHGVLGADEEEMPALIRLSVLQVQDGRLYAGIAEDAVDRLRALRIYCTAKAVGDEPVLDTFREKTRILKEFCDRHTWPDPRLDALLGGDWIELAAAHGTLDRLMTLLGT